MPGFFIRQFGSTTSDTSNMVVKHSITAQQIPGGWTRKGVQVGNIRFELILPANPDELLNQLENGAGEEPLDPYWAALWSAGPPTANLVHRHNWPPGMSALELGCGCGLVGLAALGAGLDVTFSDIVPTAIELALENARRNGFTDARGQLVDWNDPPRLQRFPQILGSDLLYETRQHTALLDTLDRLLPDEGQCWLGDPGRSAADSFCITAAERGYCVQIRDAAGEPLATSSPGQFRLIVLERCPA